jgi:hypothetical protein
VDDGGIGGKQVVDNRQRKYRLNGKLPWNNGWQAADFLRPTTPSGFALRATVSLVSEHRLPSAPSTSKWLAQRLNA